jgi:branched-chain amino acid transport system substrate-binding protein
MRPRWGRRTAAIAGIVGLLAAACQGGPTGPAPLPEIEIASELPATQIDPDARYAEMAVRFAVAGHPRLGNKFRLKFAPYDDALAANSDERVGIQNVKKMVNDHLVLGFVGPWTSDLAAAEIPIASQADLAMVSPSTTRDCLTISSPTCPAGFLPPAHSTFFRISPRDSLQGTAMADFAFGSLKATRVAILQDLSPYGELLASHFRREWTALGGTIVVSAAYPAKTGDFSAFLKDAHKGGAEAVYVPTDSTSSGFCAARAQMKGIFAPADAYFLLSDSISGQGCIDWAGDNADDHMISSLAEGPALNAAALSKYAGPVASYTFEAYDCALILIDAIERAIAAAGGAIPTRPEVLRAVAATQGYKGVTGTWAFDAHGDANAPSLSLFQVQNAGPKPAWKLLTGVTVDGSAG